MRRLRVLSAGVAVAMLAILAVGAAKPVYLQPEEVDSVALLPGPPADDSADHQAEVATLLHWQEKRTAQDVARCKSEEDVTVFAFSDVLGDWFNAKSLPITAELMDQAYVDAKAASNAAKKKWNRVRPPLADTRIHPCVALEKTASYPSGHATRGIVWATLLAEIFPDYRDKLMERGKQIGEDRVIGGMHYPSDVDAGQQLGAQIARQLLDKPDFKVAMQRAKDECLAAVH